MKTFFRTSSTRQRRARSAAMEPLAGHVEVLEDRALLSAMRVSGIDSQARDVVIQAYETLVGETPTLAEQNQLIRIEARAGQNALVPAIVATPAFYERTAGGDASRYVTLAAATLNQFPTQAEVDRLTCKIENLGARPQVLNRVVRKLDPPRSKSPEPTGEPNALYELLREDVLTNADYYSDTPEILGASLGFTHILGVPGLSGTTSTDEALARAAGGSWETLSSPSASTASQRAYTSDASVPGIASNYGYPVKYTGGFPIEFSWPVLPSTVAGSDFRVTLNTGQVVTPLAASITPNFEYNERSTVVILGYFGNRIAPGQPGAIYPVKLEVADTPTPLKLVGPGGVVVSAAGLTYGDGSTPMTAYNPGSGPKLVGAKLSVMSTLGESAPEAFSGSLPNDGVTLYGSAAQYRLRVFTSGGFSPDGVTSVLPTDFSKFFRLETVDENGVVRYLTQASVAYDLPTGTITVDGLADLWPSQASYDDSYVEDHDNQIDIILSGDEAAIATIKAVEIPASGSYSPFYNPGGPGNNPTPGVTYSQPGPSQSQPVINALTNPMTVTYSNP
ncbi:MAG: hypothetical protein JWN70_5398 [Planctomycetaceae bacterium]|nr:hypothetical protein [Planctomycetaceae bacterium]